MTLTAEASAGAEAGAERAIATLTGTGAAAASSARQTARSKAALSATGALGVRSNVVTACVVCAPEVPATLPLGKGAGVQLVEGARGPAAAADAEGEEAAAKAPLASAAAAAEATSTPSTVTTTLELETSPSFATALDSTAPGSVLTRAARLAADSAAPPTPAEPWSCGGNETATSNARLLPPSVLEARATETGEGTAAAFRDSVMSRAISASAWRERGGAATAAGEAGSVESVTVNRSVATTGAERAPTSAVADSFSWERAAAAPSARCCLVATEATSKARAVTLASAMATLASGEEEEEESERLRRRLRSGDDDDDGSSSLSSVAASEEVPSTDEDSPLNSNVSPSKSSAAGAAAAEVSAAFFANEASGAEGNTPSAVDARCSATRTADGVT